MQELERIINTDNAQLSADELERKAAHYLASAGSLGADGFTALADKYYNIAQGCRRCAADKLEEQAAYLDFIGADLKHNGVECLAEKRFTEAEELRKRAAYLRAGAAPTDSAPAPKREAVRKPKRKRKKKARRSVRRKVGGRG